MHSVVPLGDVTVLDLTRLLPGAYATLLLADLGADVIKVEDPRGGDPIRHLASAIGASGVLSARNAVDADAARTPGVQHAGVYHRLLNRNKRSITLDLRAAGAANVLDRLAGSADVIIESFRPATAHKLGLTSAALQAKHPRLIHCSITGYGYAGPYAQRGGHDLNYVALAGLLSLDRTGDETPPRMPRLLIADIAGGAMTAVMGVLAGLVARDRSGRGTVIEVSMHEAALSWLTVPAAGALAGGDMDSTRTPLSGNEAFYNVYRTSDGRYVALGALEPKFWGRFCERIGRPDLVPSQYVDGEQPRLRRELDAIFASRSRAEWMELAGDPDICLTPVNTVAEALADPHVRARASVIQDQDAHRRFIRSPIRIMSVERAPGEGLSVNESERRRPAPVLGEHTDEVLEARGFTRSEIARLRADGVV